MYVGTPFIIYGIATIIVVTISITLFAVTSKNNKKEK
jgi:hypothetical protein